MRYNYRNSIPLWILIGINVFIFILTSTNPDLGDYLALTKPITDSNYFTIFTAMFVHANILHIFFNMLTLYFFGTFCLQLIDTKWFGVVYLVSGICGNLLFLFIGPTDSAMVGASGAIFAVGGVLAVMRPMQRVYLYFFIPVPLWAVIILGFLLTAFNAGTAWQAHLGGLIVGLIAGFLLRRREHQRVRQGYYNVRW